MSQTLVTSQREESKSAKGLREMAPRADKWCFRLLGFGQGDRLPRHELALLALPCTIAYGVGGLP